MKIKLFGSLRQNDIIFIGYLKPRREGGSNESPEPHARFQKVFLEGVQL